MNYCRHWKSGLGRNRVASTPRGIEFGGTTETEVSSCHWFLSASTISARLACLDAWVSSGGREDRGGEFEVRAIHRM